MSDKRREKILAKMKEEQQVKTMDLPVNRLLNMVDENGKLKYAIADKLRKYALANPDPALNDLRMSNALLHELRWHKGNALKYMLEYENPSEDGLKDNRGNKMTKNDCYLAYISENQNVHVVLSKMREHITGQLLSKCDGVIFTLEQYDEFVTKTEAKVKEMGYELFPVEVIPPEPL